MVCLAIRNSFLNIKLVQILCESKIAIHLIQNLSFDTNTILFTTHKTQLIHVSPKLQHYVYLDGRKLKETG